MLRNINIKAVYNSEEDNILKDFYIPALSNSVSYDRAVGYFDAKMLVSAGRGLAAFINNKGYMRLICGATLKEEEYQAIKEGYGERELKARLESDFFDIVQSDDSNLFQHQLNALAWMVKNHKLDVKIALRRRGIHHQKQEFSEIRKETSWSSKGLPMKQIVHCSPSTTKPSMFLKVGKQNLKTITNLICKTSNLCGRTMPKTRGCWIFQKFLQKFPLHLWRLFIPQKLKTNLRFGSSTWTHPRLKLSKKPGQRRPKQ